MAELYGIDVSEFQGQIDWDALNAAANFVIIRASFGTARKDLRFDRNQAEARRVRDSAGPLGIGYYYFAYPTLLDPITSASYFVDNLGPLQEGEILCLDLEGDIGAQPVVWSLGFLRQVYALTGVKALIYINQSIMTGHDWSPVVNEGYGLWLADYDGNKTSVPPTGAWPVVAMKQWTDVDVVNGTPGKVDGDTFYGDFAAFNAYGYQAPQATPVSTTPATPAPQPAPPVPPAPTPAPVPPTPSVEAPPVESPSPSPEPPVIVPNSTPGLGWLTGLINLLQTLFNKLTGKK